MSGFQHLLRNYELLMRGEKTFKKLETLNMFLVLNK